MFKVKIFQGFNVEGRINDWFETIGDIEIVQISHDSEMMNRVMYQVIAIFYREVKEKIDER